MGGITNEAVENYIYGTLPARDAVLQEMEEQARQRKIPIVGPAVARMFYLLARSASAKTVFEMGSAIGYSTIWWARAVGEAGRVIYTDGDPKNAAEARGYFERAGVADRIQLRTGDALEILSEQPNEAFDIIFNDVDKEDYPRVFNLAVPRVKKGGLFVTDNVLWSGRVAYAAGNPGLKADPEATTKSVVQFNQMLMESKELFTSIIPIRDGVSVSIKL